MFRSPRGTVGIQDARVDPVRRDCRIVSAAPDGGVEEVLAVGGEGGTVLVGLGVDRLPEVLQRRPRAVRFAEADVQVAVAVVVRMVPYRDDQEALVRRDVDVAFRVGGIDPGS